MTDVYDSFERASEFAQSALELMAEKEISPKPDNFAIWYRFFSGRYPDLTKTLQVLLDSGLPFTDERNAEIYERFLGVTLDEDFLNDAADRVETELKKAIEYLSQAGSDTALYGKALSAASGAMDKAEPMEDMRATLERILQATHAMETRNERLEGRLKQSTHEIQSLREDIEDLRTQAMTDALTGLANRKQFDEDIRYFTARAMEAAGDLTLLMLDIDHFKNFNDTHGHPVGDQVLRFVAKILRDSIRGQDVAARYGGEEFVIILPDTMLHNGVKVAENIRNEVRRRTIVNRSTGENLGTITISIGAAQFTPGEQVDSLIERADAALYEAKENGRDRVETEQSVIGKKNSA